MKLLRFELKGNKRYGLLEGDTVYAMEGSPFAEGWVKGEAIGPLSSLKPLVPCEPSKILCAARNYPWGENPRKGPRPNLFYKPLSSLIGHGEDVVYPSLSREVIFESELAVVIGKAARNVPVQRAREYVFGYTCANDVTAYDLVQADGGTFRGKGFDTFCPVGPLIVTDLDPSDVMITCRVNGETRVHGSTAGMYFSCEEIISHLSEIMTLMPGDLILTGTPDVGQIHPGDLVEVEIEGIATLANRVI